MLDAASLRNQAAKCRRLSAGILDRTAQLALEELAIDLDRRANALDAAKRTDEPAAPSDHR